MFLINVIPISRGITKDRLSYFSKKDIPKGALVSVPIRSRLIPAIVESTEKVEDVKTKLRQSPFAIKKLEEVKKTQIFSSEFMQAVLETADYTAGTAGAIINTLVPKVILDNPKKVQEKIQDGDKDERKEVAYEQLVLQTDKDERYSTYRSLIREAFARKQSVFICMPTLHDVERFVSKSEKGIGTYMFGLHSGLTKKQTLERWNSAITEKHPIAIVGTGSFLSIPRSDIKTIILERESSGIYKSQVRPHVDIRVFANFLARKIGARIVYADSFLRIETLHRFYEGISAELAPLRFRPLSPAEHSIVDMKNYKPTIKGRYEIISHELALLVEETKRESTHMFIFSARRGLSPTTVCSDCGATVVSKYSSTPMVLHKTSKGNIFYCHQNGEVRSANECCRFCGGWKLVALGAGIQLIEEQLKERFPEHTFFRIDSDVTNTYKKARATVLEWQNTPGGVLIGTEMALSHIEGPIEHVAVASIDSLLSIPDFKIETKILSVLLTLRSLAQQTFLLQTRNPEQQVLKDAVQGNLLEFYRREIKLRKELEYPPFSLFIKLTVSGTKVAVAKEMDVLEELFKEYDLRVFSAFIPTGHGKQTSHALIKIKPNMWTHPDLLEKLRSLPPQILVKVDPESLL
jgi:primosomal protein N'